MRLARLIPQSMCLAAGVLAAATLPACNNDSTSNDTPYVVVPLTTATLAGTPGRALAETLGVEVRTADGHPVPGAKVDWSLPQGGSVAVVGAQLNGATSGTTDDKGRTYAVWTLGLPEGAQQAKAAVGLGEPAAFTATATALHVLAVSVGNGYVCAVLTDNRPACWGDNRFGQLGTGDTVSTSAPVTPVGLAAVQEIQASTGGTTCARDMGGDVWCWGFNNHGQAGPGAANPMQLVPVRVAGAEGASSVAPAGNFGFYTCAVLQAGGARCWGLNDTGQLGVGDTVASATPRAVVGGGGFVQVAAGPDRACAVTAARDVWCWGDGRGENFAPYPSGIYLSPIQPIPGYRLSSVEITYSASCGLEFSGEVLCWGDPIDLGLGTVAGPFPLTAPVHPVGVTPFAQVVSDGVGLAFGRTRDGHVIYWGTVGGDWTRFPTPLDISLGVESIAAGDNVYCIIASSGALYCDSSLYWFDQGKNALQAMPAP